MLGDLSLVHKQQMAGTVPSSRHALQFPPLMTT